MTKKKLIKKDDIGDWYLFGECSVCVSKDNGMWHISVSHPRRYPTYDEIKEARYEFTPNEVPMAMIFPPKKEFVNLHTNCFHLYQIYPK